jgi:hypothetical protein
MSDRVDKSLQRPRSERWRYFEAIEYLNLLYFRESDRSICKLIAKKAIEFETFS